MFACGIAETDIHTVFILDIIPLWIHQVEIRHHDQLQHIKTAAAGLSTWQTNLTRACL